MNAGAVPASGRGRVRARENRDAGGVELFGSREGVLKFARADEWHVLHQVRLRIGRKVLCEALVRNQRRATRCSQAALDGGQGCLHKGMMTMHNLSKVGLRWRVGKEVRETVGAGRDGVSRVVLRRNVNDGQFAPLMCGLYGSSELFFGESSERNMANMAVLLNDFDIVAALGNTVAHELLRFRGARQRRDRHSEFSAVTLWRRHYIAR